MKNNMLPPIKKETIERPPADGGLRGWLCVSGAFCISFCTFGYLNSFGIYQAYYKNTLLSQLSESTISWIGSLQIFFLFSTGLLSGPLADMYGPKVILYPCCSLFVFATMMTSVCKSYYQFLLCQGILGGLMSGMSYTPALAAVGQHFHHRRAVALSVVMSGSSLGGIIYSIMLNKLLNKTTLGFGWSVRVVGFLNLLLCCWACFTITSNVEKRKGRIFLLEAWTKRPYTIQVFGMSFIMLGLFIPFFFISSFAVDRGISTDYSFDLLAILNGPSLVGRLCAGPISIHTGKFNTLIVGSICCGILVISWLGIESQVSITVFAVLIGLFSGVVVGLFTTTIAMLSDAPNKIGTYVGMSLTVYGLSALAGPPIAGAMLAEYHTYWPCIVFSGVSILLGSFVLCIARYSFAGMELIA